MQLFAHRDDPASPVQALRADATRTRDGRIRLEWRLEADVSLLRLPAPAPPARADGLWRHTCFEAFVAGAGRADYVELNFAPSGAWAAYRFTGYRAGMAPLELAMPPAAGWQRVGDCLRLHVEVDLPGASGALRIALAAVVEQQSGTISHWALRHGEGKPDFHHPGGFALELPATADTKGRDRW